MSDPNPAIEANLAAESEEMTKNKLSVEELIDWFSKMDEKRWETLVENEIKIFGYSGFDPKFVHDVIVSRLLSKGYNSVTGRQAIIQLCLVFAIRGTRIDTIIKRSGKTAADILTTLKGVLNIESLPGKVKPRESITLARIAAVFPFFSGGVSILFPTDISKRILTKYNLPFWANISALLSIIPKDPKFELIARQAFAYAFIYNFALSTELHSLNSSLPKPNPGVVINILESAYQSDYVPEFSRLQACWRLGIIRSDPKDEIIKSVPTISDMKLYLSDCGDHLAPLDIFKTEVFKNYEWYPAYEALIQKVSKPFFYEVFDATQAMRAACTNIMVEKDQSILTEESEMLMRQISNYVLSAKIAFSEELLMMRRGPAMMGGLGGPGGPPPPPAFPPNYPGAPPPQPYQPSSGPAKPDYKVFKKIPESDKIKKSTTKEESAELKEEEKEYEKVSEEHHEGASESVPYYSQELLKTPTTEIKTLPPETPHKLKVETRYAPPLTKESMATPSTETSSKLSSETIESPEKQDPEVESHDTDVETSTSKMSKLSLSESPMKKATHSKSHKDS